MEEIIRKELPNVPDRLFSLDDLYEYIDSESVAEEVADSLIQSNCQDYVLVEMVLIALSHLGYEKQFLDLCHHFESSELVLVHYELYCLQKVIRGEAPKSELENVEENIKNIRQIEYRFFINWLANCYVELYKGNYDQARGIFDIAVDRFNQPISNENVSAAKKLIKFGPLLDLTGGFIAYANGDYNAARNKFNEVALSSISSIPMVRLGLGFCYLHLDRKESMAIAAFQTCLRIEASTLAAEHIKKLQAINATEDVDESTKMNNEKAIEDLKKVDQLPLNLALELLIDNGCKFKNIKALIQLAMIDRNNFKTYFRVADFSDPRDIGFNLYKAQTLYEAGKYKKVLHLLYKDADHKDALHVRCKDNAELHSECLFQIARSNHKRDRKKDVDSYIQLYEVAYRINPKHVGTCYALAHLNMCKGNLDKAIGYLEPVKDQLLNKYEMHMVMGMCYATKYRNSFAEPMEDRDRVEIANKAKSYLSEALRLINNKSSEEIAHSEHYKLYTTLGWLCLKTLEFTNARENFSKAVELMERAGLTPDDQTLTFLAISEFQNEKYDKALATYQRVANQSNPIIQFNIGRCYEGIGDLDKAIKIYEQQTIDYPTFAEPYLRLGYIALNDKTTDIAGSLGRAKEYFQTVIQECKTQKTRASIYLAMAYNKEGKYDSSTKILHDFLKQHRNDKKKPDGYLTAEVMYANAFLQHAQTKQFKPQEREDFLYSNVYPYYYGALRSEHNCVCAASGLALYWLLRGHVKEARDQLRIVKENLPQLAGPSECLANAYLRGSSEEIKPAQAAIEFEECNKSHYDRTNIQIFIGAYLAFKDENKYENCLTMAEYMIQLEPDRKIFWYFLASSIFYIVRQKAHELRQNRDVRKLRVKDVDRLTKQLLRARELFNAYGNAEGKISNIDKRLLPRLEELRAKAVESEEMLHHSRGIGRIPNATITE